MADFELSFQKTLLTEGGYANNPRDTGGETWQGIARKKHPDWEGWDTIDLMRNLIDFPEVLGKSLSLKSQVLGFYKKQFWDIYNLDQLQSQQMANEIYDTGVNMGSGRAALWFQRVLNVVSRKNELKLDAVIGNKTIGLFNSLSDSDKYIVWKLYNCLQGEKYISICEANPSQKIFIRSWANRVFEK